MSQPTFPPAPIPAAFEPVCATNFSFLRGASHGDELVWTARRLGLSGIGVADRNSVAGVVRAHVAAKEAGLRLIVGARLVETGEAGEAGEMDTIIYPRTRAAWGVLTSVLTRGNRRAKKGDCHITWTDVREAMEDACAILMPPAVLDDDWLDEARRRIAEAPRTCRILVAVTRPFDGTDRERMAVLAALVKQTRARLIATNDTLFHGPERRLLADVLMCIREKKLLDQAGTARLANAERCLKAPDEMVRIFAAHPDAIAAQADLFAAIDFSLDQLRYEYPDEVVSEGETPMQSLRRLSEEGARGRYRQGIPPAVRAALDHEYALIEQLDYARYFLTVHDIVAFARSRGILCQGRGSAANSVVCYCLGVTAVDPVKVDLLFERFVSPERREPPDIDVDFEHERREEVIQYIYAKYGRHRAGIAGTVITYRGRSALREAGKVMGLSNDTIEALSKSVWGWGKGGIDVELVKTMTGLDVTAPRIAKTLELARALHGFPRHLSQHVGGFVITRGPLEAVVPIGNAAMPDRTFVEWDKDDLDALGILKIDVLALGMLTCVARALDLLREHKGIDLDLATVPPEDPATYAMISNADTVGVFQIESRAQMSMLPRLRPATFYDLVIEVAIVRPGPIQGDMVHPYLRRRQGLEKVTYPSKALEAVLGKTLGVPLFQEQAMRIAIVAAGFSPAEADRLRRAMATFRKVGIIHEFGLRLVEGMVANGYEREFAERCFRQIEGFGEYGFPESHAASFALIVYVSAWLKRHHPDVFCAAILNAQPMGFYAPAQLVRDARDHGVTVLAPDVNESDWDATLESPHPVIRDGHGETLPVRLGLREIRGFAEADAARIMAARQAGGRFQDAEDLKRRARLNGRAMDLLANADALRSMALDRRAALWQAKGLAEAALPLFAHLDEYGPEADPALPEMPLSEHVVHDYAALRLSLKAHPVSFLRTDLAARRFMTARDLATAANGRMLDLAGLVLVRQKPGTAKGVLFVTLEDETGSANLIVWPKVFERFRRTVLGAKLLHVRGQLQREGQVIHVIARSLTDMTWRLGELSDANPDEAIPFVNTWARADEVRAPAEDPRAQAHQKHDARTTRVAAAFTRGRNFH
jgi:error-prone DNA polymerase